METISQEDNVRSPGWSTRRTELELGDFEDMGWAVGKENVPQLLKVLSERRLYSSNSDFKLSFTAFRLVLKLIHDSGIDTSDLINAVTKFLNNGSDSVGDDLRTVLLTFFPGGGELNRALGDPTNWEVSRLIDYLNSYYFIKPEHLSASEVATIAQRIQKVLCHEENIPARLVNPFCKLVERDGDGYQILKSRVNQNGIVGNEKGELFAELPDIFNAQSAQASNIFIRFSAWLSLLKLTKPGLNLNIELFAEQGGTEPGHLNADPFIVEPDKAYSIQKTTSYRLIIFPQPIGIENEVILCFFKRDFSITFIYAKEKFHKFDDFLDNTISAKKFEVPNPNQYIFGVIDAEYVKVFVLRRGYVTYTQLDRNSPTEANRPHPLFHELMTMRDEDLLATYTIGFEIQKEEPKKNIPTKGSPQDLIKHFDIEPATIKQTKQPSPKTQFKLHAIKVRTGKTTLYPDDPQRGIWGKSDAKKDKKLLVTVGLANVTKTFPITIHLEVKSKKQYKYAAFFVGKQDSPRIVNFKDNVASIVINPQKAVTIGALVDDDTELELDLNDVRGFPKSFYRITLEEEVKELLKTRAIQDKEDPQKKRWGGKSDVSGNKLTATVKNSKGERNFEINVTLKTSARIPQDKAVFFLHDSFNEPVRYVNIVNGEAKLNLFAYEGFTIGAFIASTKQTLELDLCEVKGYPQDFYPANPPRSFKNTVKAEDKRRKIIIKNDTQKQRWGGAPTRNGKTLLATVKPESKKWFTVTLTVKGTSAKTVTGFVAFFLDGTFNPDIRFKKASGGQAQLTISAYEAFTVGALLEDGTELELDLNETEGFPSDFYYGHKPGLKKQTTYRAKRPNRLK